MVESDTQPEPRSPGLFRLPGLRIALVLIAALAWIFAILDWSTLGYEWRTNPETPHPEITLVELDPKFGLGSESDALVVGEQIVWRRPRGSAPLALFSATGVEGEPAVRVCEVRESATGGGPPDISTVGYAERGESGWIWLTEAESTALERAEEARREALLDPSKTGELKPAPN